MNFNNTILTDTPLIVSSPIEQTYLHFLAQLCIQAHWLQTDKAGAPYFFHPMSVASRVTGFVRQASALLHDVIEDTEMTLEDLRQELHTILDKEMEASVSDTSQLRNSFPNILSAVDCLTRREKEDEDEYYSRVLSNDDAIFVKLSDLTDNLSPFRCKMASKWKGLSKSIEKHQTRCLQLISVVNEKGLE